MSNQEKINKVAEIVKDIRTCMFTTESKQGDMISRPMSTIDFDEEGNIWFFTDINSDKVDELKEQKNVLLSYAKPSNNTFLSITGNATISDDQSKKEEKFGTISKAWFPEGPTSEKLALIKFTPDSAEYWDSPNSSLVQLFRIGKAIAMNTKYEGSNDENETVEM